MELLIVEIDCAYLGVPTSDVKEVVRAARVSPAAGANGNIKGLLNLRGTVIPVVSTRALLGLADRDVLATDHFIVLQTEPGTFALHVDRAVEILNVSDPSLDRADDRFAASVPHAEFGVIQIHQGCSLWAQAGLACPSGSPSTAPHGGAPLP